MRPWDCLLAPAYHLICTALHIDDSSLALRDGLYEGDTKEAACQNLETIPSNGFGFCGKSKIAIVLAEKIIDETIMGLGNHSDDGKKFFERGRQERNNKTAERRFSF